MSAVKSYMRDSFIEIFNRIIFNSISPAELLVALFVSIIIGLYIFIIYKISFRSTVYSYTFNMSLVLMVIITTLIILTVSSNNLIVTLGMLGTLGVVRFRSSLKEPLDILYVLWASAAGFAIGATQYLIAILGSIIVGILIYSLSHFRVKMKSYIIVINYPKAIDKEISLIASKKNIRVKAKYIKKGNVELTLEVRNKYQQTLDLFDKVELIESISLLSFED
ncbi:MAG: rane protein [Haloplasmataceae bacterium]|nr:rane protein [Haloplasmataceae bacterium]